MFVPKVDVPDRKERSYVLRLSELPRWLRWTIGLTYLAWVSIVTAVTAHVVVRSLYFDSELVPTTQTIVLLVGLLIAPLFPFAQKLFFPGGGRVELDAAQTRQEGRTAEAGIERAMQASRLPPLDFGLEDDGE